MTVFVFRNGVVVPKGSDRAPDQRLRSDLAAPMLSRMEPFQSPVTDKEISSWRERDRDMAAAGAVDPRDLPAPTRGRAAQKRGTTNGRRTAADDTFQWRDPA